MGYKDGFRIGRCPRSYVAYIHIHHLRSCRTDRLSFFQYVDAARSAHPRSTAYNVSHAYARAVDLALSRFTSHMIQVAIRTDRCAGLAVGGWPPLDGPFDLLPDPIRGLDGSSDAFTRSFSNALVNYYRSIWGKG